MFDPTRDIVLITGGSQGLGKELAAKFNTSGAKVIVFDLNIPDPGTDNNLSGIIYVKCDVSDRAQVVNKVSEIEQNVGNVTLLINNAGITMGKSLVDLSFDDIEKTLEINLLSSFYTIKAVLPSMMKGKRGYIVTIASTLGYLSPARLSAYGASKSGLIALHESLTYELGPPSLNTTGVKTLLICPGQLKTTMFQGVRTPSTLLAPELDPKYVASTVYKSVVLGKRGEIKLPFYGNFIPLIRVVPWPLAQIIRYATGMDESMKKFVGNAVSLSSSSASTMSATLNTVQATLSNVADQISKAIHPEHEES